MVGVAVYLYVFRESGGVTCDAVDAGSGESRRAACGAVVDVWAGVGDCAVVVAGCGFVVGRGAAGNHAAVCAGGDGFLAVIGNCGYDTNNVGVDVDACAVCVDGPCGGADGIACFCAAGFGSVVVLVELVRVEVGDEAGRSGESVGSVDGADDFGWRDCCGDAGFGFGDCDAGDGIVKKWRGPEKRSAELETRSAERKGAEASLCLLRRQG